MYVPTYIYIYIYIYNQVDMYVPTFVYTRYICVYQVTIKLSVSLHEDDVLYSEFCGLMLTNGPLNLKTQLVA